MTLTRALVSFLFVLTVIISPYGRTPASAAEEPIRVVVMDPLARPLACDCVKGYAQRDYDRLGRFLVIPEAGRRHLGFEFGHFLLACRQVKESPGLQ